MKICVFGAGAIGGYIGAKIALAGAEVSFVARGPHLAAMRAHGVRLREGGSERQVNIRCTSEPAELGPQDYLIIALKAHTVSAVVGDMQPLLGPDTAVVTAFSGIPYWYFYNYGGDLAGTMLESVDPGGRQWRGLGPQRAIGCVLYPAVDVVEPGVIQHVHGKKFPVGEPGGAATLRVRRLAQIMADAGFDAPVRDDIRDEIWLKLWGNLCFNPISALTHATLDVIASDPGTRALARAMMLEARVVAERLGTHFRVDPERRIDGAGAVGPHKTSMLVDLEHGKAMEIDPMLTVVKELGALTHVPTPTVDAVLALVKLREQVALSHRRDSIGSGPAVTQERDRAA